MHVDYKIRLPDHDFAKATKQKLVPYLYAACEIFATSSKAIPEISYSGPRYIAICSGQHDWSTAYSHQRDFGHVLELEQFQSIDMVGNETKPMTMIFTDGGPGENPRFRKALDVFIQLFKKHKFEFIRFLCLSMSLLCQPRIKWKKELHH